MRKLFRETLKKFEKIPYSKAAEELLLGTCAAESHYGKYVVQMGGGPARGIMQIEAATCTDVFNNYLIYREELLEEVLKLVICDLTFNWNDKKAVEHELQINHKFSIIIARLCYYRAPAKLPKEDDLDGLAKYWKKYYNTELGKGTVKHFKTCYNNFVKYDEV